MSEKIPLKRTPLFDTYKELGAKLIEFGGWEMPVHFSSIIEEHEAVRNNAGVFDVSHMGQILVEGKDAEAFLNELVTNDVTKCKVNQCQYTLMCKPDGGIIDDFLIYKLDENKYWLVVNAANTDKDYEWIKQHVKDNVMVENISTDIGQLALQGPKAEEILQKLTETDLSQIRFYRFQQGVEVAGIPDVLISRTGYTGEDGFELYVKADRVAELWDQLLEAGKDEGLLPCGLGARDTLRFEAGLGLYGQELSEDWTPLEAGLGFAVKFDKEDFIGKDALQKQKEKGIPRNIVGLEVTGKGIPRTGYKVFTADEEQEIGVITSGTHAPTLKKALGLALIESEYTEPGTAVKIQIRKRFVDALVVNKPFYKRKK